MRHAPASVYALVAFGLVSFSFSPILVRLAGEAPGLAVAALRTCWAVLFLLPFALARIGPELKQLTGREWILIVSAGVFLGFHFVTWIESLYYTSVASASVLVTTSPIFLAVFGLLLLKERLTRRTVAAIVLGVLGAAVIGWGDAAAETSTHANPLLGNSLALTAALLVSFYLLIGRIVRQRVSWLAYVFPLYAVVAVTTLVLAVGQGVSLTGYSWPVYLYCALMALGPQILGHGSFNYALKYLPAALLGLLSLVEPVGASVMAFVLFGEVPNVLAVVGMVIVLASVGAAIWEPRETATSAAP